MPKRGIRSGRRAQNRRRLEKTNKRPRINNVQPVQLSINIVILPNYEGEITQGLNIPRVRFPESDPLGLLVRPIPH